MVLNYLYLLNLLFRAWVISVVLLKLELALMMAMLLLLFLKNCVATIMFYLVSIVLCSYMVIKTKLLMLDLHLATLYRCRALIWYATWKRIAQIGAWLFRLKTPSIVVMHGSQHSLTVEHVVWVWVRLRTILFLAFDKCIHLDALRRQNSAYASTLSTTILESLTQHVITLVDNRWIQ